MQSVTLYYPGTSFFHLCDCRVKLLLMLIFGFWFSTEVSCQIVYGDLDRVFHIEENIRKMKDAQLEAALEEDRAGAEEDQPR